MASVMSDFWKSRQKTSFIANFYEFIAKVDEYRAIYDSGSILENTDTNDVLFLYNSWSTGVIFGVVDHATATLDNIGDIDLYGRKHIWYRELTISQVDHVLNTNSWAVFSYDFFRDKIFSDIYVSDFQLRSYNSAALFNLDVDVIIYYKDDLDGGSIDDLIPDDLFRTTLTF